MTEEELLLELEQAIGDMNLRIRYEKGDFDGGYCILKEERIIIVNKKLSPFRKSAVIALAMGEYGIENIYLKPIVRTFIEDEIVKSKVQSAKNMVKRNSAHSSEEESVIEQSDEEPKESSEGEQTL